MTVLSAGAVDQAESQVYDTTIEGGEHCTINAKTDTTHDTSTSISDSDKQYVEVVRTDTDYTITTIDKDELGNLLPETKNVHTITLGDSADSTDSADSADSSLLTNSLNSSLRSGSAVANGESAYWKKDYWYIYVNNKWHIYY